MTMVKQLSLAVFAGSVAPCMALAVLSTSAYLIHPEPGQDMFRIVGGALFSFVGLAFSIPAITLIGLPAFLLLRAFRLANIYSCIAVSMVPIAIAAFLPKADATSGKLLAYGLLFLVSALAFWYFARRTLPGYAAHPGASANGPAAPAGG